MISSASIACILGFTLTLVPLAARAQPAQAQPVQARLVSPPRLQALQSAAIEVPPRPSAAVPASGLLSAITLADIGFVNGIRFANLGGRRELFVPLPQVGAAAASELVLVLDDISAHDARRNLEVQVNDRTLIAIVLDGKSRGRSLRIPLAKAKPKDGFLKLSFLYSGAATLDRCIDVRYVGDSLTIRPETAVEVDVGATGALDVATTVALMPREVALVLPGRRLAGTEVATALSVARSLIGSGRQVTFHRGYETIADLDRRGDAGHWTRGIILIGTLAEASGVIDSPVATLAGPLPAFGTLAAVRIGGAPALVVSDGSIARAGLLLAGRSLAATRGSALASVGDATAIGLPTDRVTFDQLGIAPAQAEVFGRADLSAVVDTRRLPGGTRPARVLLDVMVAPDGAGAKAVVSAFVNERLLGSTVAASGETTHLDLALPDGLVGTNANIRAVVQRDSAQGDCRFEPQGYPAQMLGSSTLVLTAADGLAHDFSDLVARWSNGLEVLLPAAAADQPKLLLGLVAQVVSGLSPDNAPIRVTFVPPGGAPAPSGPFLAVSEQPPAGTSARVRFDRGRVAVTDRSGRTLLDLGGFVTGAVAQVVTAGEQSGLWIKLLSSDGAAPVPPDLHLDHGDVAFLDSTGVALAMSTERDAVIRISYPDQVSWLTVADRFRSWIIAGVWLFATAFVLFALQRVFRRRPADANE
jgi:cellulose synthase operon protein B